jgi:predicted  nucleic acid-binding Zn ribbon protein
MNIAKRLGKWTFNKLYRLAGSPLRFISCPSCKRSHVDLNEWAGRPHRTHLCAYCGNKWVFESDVKTVGI